MNSLRITTSAGEVVREPDRATLIRAVESAGRSGLGAFVVLDGDTAGDAPFLQATRVGNPTGTAWRVEVWRVAGHGAGERYGTFVADDVAVAEVFWSWATGSDAWQQLRWQQVPDRPLAAAG